MERCRREIYEILETHFSAGVANLLCFYCLNCQFSSVEFDVDSNFYEYYYSGQTLSRSLRFLF